jgi:hypothetical protein
MPNEILEIVQAGIEIAKNPPKIIKEATAEPLSSDPDEARAQFNKPF